MSSGDDPLVIVEHAATARAHRTLGLSEPHEPGEGMWRGLLTTDDAAGHLNGLATLCDHTIDLIIRKQLKAKCSENESKRLPQSGRLKAVTLHEKPWPPVCLASLQKWKMMVVFLVMKDLGIFLPQNLV